MNTLFIGKSPDLISYYKFHSHECWEIVIPIFGLGCVQTENQMLEFYPESIYIVPPNISHSTISKKHFTDIFIHTSHLPFDKERLTSVYGIKNLPAIAELIYSLYLNDPKNNIETIHTAVEFIVKLCLNISKKETLHPLGKAIKDFLVENISNPDITMNTLEQNFQYNGDYLRRLFKYDYDETPMEYLNNLRLNQAKDLLKNMPIYSVCQIGELCGFTDPLYFSRFFKRHIGLSPKKYQNSVNVRNQ